MDAEREAIKAESKERAEYQRQLLNEMIEATTYKKGQKRKEVVKLPMPTSHDIMANKSVNLKTYGAIMLNSKWGGTFLNPEERYIYDNFLREKCEEISKECNISVRTLKRHIAALKKCNVKIFEPVVVNGDLVYRLNYSIEGREFITIDSVALRKLCNAYSENTLKLYLILSYTCIEVKKGKGKLKYNITGKEKLITQEWLCKKLGLSYGSRIIITDCVEALKRGGFINVREEYKINNSFDDSKVIKIHKKPEFYYSLSDDYLTKK